MTARTAKPAVHSTFRIERHYKVPPARVFFAFSDMASKRRWMVEGEGFTVFEYTADFRVGSGELARFAYGKGPEIVMQSVYQDIVPNERIVFCYRMAIGDTPMSASLTTMSMS